MNETKLAILRDVGLANNGYVTKHSTMANVRNAVKGSTLSSVREAFDDLVTHRHLVLLGKDRDNTEYYCLPENRHRIIAMMEDLTR